MYIRQNIDLQCFLNFQSFDSLGRHLLFFVGVGITTVAPNHEIRHHAKQNISRSYYHIYIQMNEKQTLKPLSGVQKPHVRFQRKQVLSSAQGDNGYLTN
jgi:hypothetical protein